MINSIMGRQLHPVGMQQQAKRAQLLSGSAPAKSVQNVRADLVAQKGANGLNMRAEPEYQIKTRILNANRRPTTKNVRAAVRGEAHSKENLNEPRILSSNYTGGGPASNKYEQVLSGSKLKYHESPNVQGAGFYLR